MRPGVAPRPEGGAICAAQPRQGHTPTTPADASSQKEHAPFVEPASEQRGFILDLPLGLAIPFGSYANGVEADSFGAGASFGLLLGFYVTEHVGVLGGISGSTGHQGISGCHPKEDHCGGTRYQFPVLVQYALRDRKQGPSFQTGLGLASTYRVVVEGVGAFAVSSPFDAKFGLGYRLAAGALATRNAASRWSLDFFANLDVGRFQHEHSSVVKTGMRFDGDIDRPAMHYLTEFGVAIHWTP